MSKLRKNDNTNIQKPGKFTGLIRMLIISIFILTATFLRQPELSGSGAFWKSVCGLTRGWAIFEEKNFDKKYTRVYFRGIQ